jgi:Holliday junction resolvasome RuvABC endonuclease subunit
MLLSLDISTSVIGCCVFKQETKQLIYTQAIILPKDLSFVEKAKYTKDSLETIKNKYPVNSVAVEESLSGFAAGKTSRQTLILLSKFNAVICWILGELFSVSVQELNATKVRKALGIVKTEDDIKKDVLSYMRLQEPDFVVEHTRFGNPKKHYYDIADSYVIGRYSLICS